MLLILFSCILLSQLLRTFTILSYFIISILLNSMPSVRKSRHVISAIFHINYNFNLLAV